MGQAPSSGGSAKPMQMSNQPQQFQLAEMSGGKKTKSKSKANKSSGGAKTKPNPKANLKANPKANPRANQKNDLVKKIKIFE
jgi:hypothetical protein